MYTKTLFTIDLHTKMNKDLQDKELQFKKYKKKIHRTKIEENEINKFTQYHIMNTGSTSSRCTVN